MKFSNVKKAKQESDERRKNGGGGGAWAQPTPAVYLRDGESTTFWLIGSDDEPYEATIHTVKFGTTAKGSPKFEEEVCHGENCPFCAAKDNKDERVGYAKSQFRFSAFETKVFHYKDVVSAKGTAYKEFFPCTGDVMCKFCKAKMPKQMGGKKVVKLAAQWANALAMLDESLRHSCKSCGKGKLAVVGIKNDKGKTIPNPEEYDLSDLPAGWEVIYKCSKCKDPTPKKITDTAVVMSRSGSSTDTTYSFAVDESEDRPDAMLDEEPIDFAKEAKPSSPKWIEKKYAGTIRMPEAEVMRGTPQRKGFHQPPKGREKNEYEDEDEEELGTLFPTH